MHRTRSAVVGVVSAMTLLALATAPASAHVDGEPTEVPAGSVAEITLSTEHGCDGAPTSELAVQIPDGVLQVTPHEVPGWDIGVETEPLPAPVDLGGGEVVTERATVVTFTARPGNELPDGVYGEFTLGYRAPDTPGTYLFFKTIQRCTGGAETAWIEEYTGTGEEPEHPAPAVLLTPGAGVTTETSEAPTTASTTETTATTTATSEVAGEPVSESDDESSNTLPIVLTVVVLVLAAAGVVFAKTRKA